MNHCQDHTDQCERLARIETKQEESLSILKDLHSKQMATEAVMNKVKGGWLVILGIPAVVGFLASKIPAIFKP